MTDCLCKLSWRLVATRLAVEMQTHDPKKIVELLRDHLATHDKKLAFLFGAGTSAAVNVGTDKDFIALIPAVKELTAKCKEAIEVLGENQTAAWAALVQECKNAGAQPNVEAILSRVRLKIESAGVGDKPLGLTVAQVQEVERTIRKTIAQIVALDEEAIPASMPHDRFALWVKRITRTQAVEVFTTNYDVLIERALENARLGVFDGFVGSYRPFFSPQSVENDSKMPGVFPVRLWKIHGSVNWEEIDVDGSRRIVRGDLSGEGQLIYPTHKKYDQSRKQPYLSLLDRLGHALSGDGALLVTCGYSFGDQHINAAILDVLDGHPLSHVIVLQHGDLAADSELVNEAMKRPNLMVIGRNAAVVAGIWGGWKLREPLTDGISQYVDILFDSCAAPENDDVALEGRMRAGDFVQFCEFLNNMGA
ncbi:MAG: SIR2 family protein [Coriobacteriia bacterium]